MPSPYLNVSPKAAPARFQKRSTAKSTGSRENRGESSAWRANLVAIGIVLAAGIAAYGNSLSGEFIFDDLISIVDNSTLRSLGDWREVLLPPRRNGTTVDGRPWLNLSLAVNYYFHSLDVFGYHAVNLAIHAANASLLWLIIYEALATRRLSTWFGAHRRVLATCIAGLWVVHPLTTSAVTYTIQRAESLMAFFYLLATLLFLVGCRARFASPWLTAAAVICFVGQGAKEVMATAPVFLLVLDISLLSGSVRTAVRQRGWWHALMFLSLVPAVYLILGGEGRSGSIGFDNGCGPLDYLACQCGYLLRYFRLCFWPTPLILDYGVDVPRFHWAQLSQVAAVLFLFSATVFLWFRQSAAGLPGLLAFVILAPTSSVIPVLTQTAAEHRMYLPLACILAGAVLLAFRSVSVVLLNGSPYKKAGPQHRTVGFAAAVAVVGVLFGLLTLQRNATYCDSRSIWLDTASKVPTNIRACKAAAHELLRQGRVTEASQVFAPALAVHAKRMEALRGRLAMWSEAGRMDLALRDGQEALVLAPQSFAAYSDLGVLATQRGDLPLAIELLTRSIELQPREALPRINRGNALALAGHPTQAKADYEFALSLNPATAGAHFGLGRLEHGEGRLAAAAISYERAIYYQATHSAAIESVVDVYCELRYFDKAKTLVSRLLREDPTDNRLILMARIIEEEHNPADAARFLGQLVSNNNPSAEIRAELTRLLHAAQPGTVNSKAAAALEK